MEKCEDCKYFIGEETSINFHGRCHRHPPWIGGTEEYPGEFLIVNISDWCGDFIKKEKKNEKN